MWGQWYGGIEGDNATILLNVDRQSPGEGRVHVFNRGAQAASLSAVVNWSAIRLRSERS
jgi:hypothetical protein